MVVSTDLSVFFALGGAVRVPKLGWEPTLTWQSALIAISTVDKIHKQPRMRSAPRIIFLSIAACLVSAREISAVLLVYSGILMASGSSPSAAGSAASRK